MQLKDDKIQLNGGKINSLEMDGGDKLLELEKFHRIVVNMTAEIKKLKEKSSRVAGNELKSTIKKT